MIITPCVYPPVFVSSSLLLVDLQGILFAGTDCLKAPVDLVRLWLHEGSRVYGDKLVDDKDMETFAKMKFEFAKKFFEVSANKCSLSVELQDSE